MAFCKADLGIGLGWGVFFSKPHAQVHDTPISCGMARLDARWDVWWRTWRYLGCEYDTPQYAYSAANLTVALTSQMER
jgi:hypothetical protein